MDINKLAEITAQEFEVVHGEIAEMRGDIKDLKSGQARLESGLQKVFEVVLEIPTKKQFNKLVHKVEDIDDRVTVVERKLQISHS